MDCWVPVFAGTSGQWYLGGHDRADSHRRRLYAALAPDRLHARHHAGGDHRRRAGRRRLLRRLPAAQSFPRHFCRRRVQCRLHSRLRAHSHPGRTCSGGSFGDRIFTLLVATQAVLLALALLFTPQVDRAARARLLARAAAIRARGRADADHLPLSPAHHAGDAVGRHSQRAASLRGGGRGADPAQPVDDGDAGARRILPGRGYAAAWGVLDIRRAAGRAGRRRRAAQRRHDLVPRAALGRRRAALLQGAGAGDDRVGRHAARAVRRHHHRELPVGRRDLRALLRRPHRPAADRRHRHCGRHRAVAGDDAPASRPATMRAPARRRTGPSNSRCSSAIPCVVAFLVVPDLIMRGLFMRGAFHGRRRARGGDDAHGLHDRP